MRAKANRWASKNPMVMKEKRDRWAKSNPQVVAAQKRNRKKRKASHDSEYRNGLTRKVNRRRALRAKNDPAYGVLLRLRDRLKDALNGARKVANTMTLVGCTREELLQHLQRHFLPGMTWDNRHLWHIDHIRPCASFDMSRPEQQRACFHFTNLQPLWAWDNIAKGDRLIA